MNEQTSSAMETPDLTVAGHTQVGWGFWVFSVPALAVVGALSYLVAAQAPMAVLTLPPAAMLIFGFLAGAVHGFSLRRQLPPARWWILASSLAGFVAALVSVVTTSGTETAVGLFAGWTYAWAAYGTVFGLMLQRKPLGRWMMLVSIAGWAMAGIVSGAVGWALDVFQITETIPTQAFFDLPSRTWSLAGLAVVGAVCGATGGAITSAAFVLLSRVPVRQPDRGEREAKDWRLVKIAGVICGLIAALLCTYSAPLVVTALIDGSLESLDLTIFFLSAAYGTPVCIPTLALVSIPVSIGCGYAGLEIGRAIGRQGSKLLVWLGAAVGGVAGYALGALVAFAIGYVGG